jgi:hypothetical protein
MHNRVVLNLNMSFGYSVGDCIAICQLANQLRDRFADAPYQFKAISNEYVLPIKFVKHGL